MFWVSRVHKVLGSGCGFCGIGCRSNGVGFSVCRVLGFGLWGFKLGFGIRQTEPVEAPS